MASRLFAYFAMCWTNHAIDDAGLQKAVDRGYITPQEKQDILALPQHS